MVVYVSNLQTNFLVSSMYLYTCSIGIDQLGVTIQPQNDGFWCHDSHIKRGTPDQARRNRKPAAVKGAVDVLRFMLVGEVNPPVGEPKHGNFGTHNL